MSKLTSEQIEIITKLQLCKRFTELTGGHWNEVRLTILGINMHYRGF
jgi:hypothetical protein